MLSKTVNRWGSIKLGVSVLLLTALPLLSEAKPYSADWLHKTSDLKADPNVTFGTLPNGMRYAIMKNNTPKDAVSMRLRIDAGSVQENDAQQGIAHLLEHMAFRGSKKIADGEVVKTLERLGLRFGADTNASTSFTETIYKFDLPRSDKESIDTGMTLLREIASELNLSDTTLATERGVVLSELRIRDVAAQRAAKAELQALLPGQPMPTRFPGGQKEVIETADPKLLRSFYDAYYQPKRTTLVIVGNVDIAAIAKQITATFSNWKNTRSAADDPEFGAPKPQSTTTRIYTEESLPTRVAVEWAAPYDASAPTVARKANETIESIGTAILNERLAKLALQKDAPYTGAFAYTRDMERSAHVAALQIITTPEKWQSALTAARGVFNTTLQQGVTQQEVDRFVKEMITRNKVAAEQAATRATPALANNITASLGDNHVVLHPQYIAELNAAAADRLKAETATAALRKAFPGDSSLIFMSSSASVPDGETTLAAAHNASLKAAADVSQIASNTELVWSYTDFGTPGKITNKLESAEQQATFVNFANGVVLGVRPTKFAEGEVQVVFKLSGGLLAMNQEAAVPSMLSAYLTQGGLEKLDFLAIRKVMSGKTVSASASATDGQLLLTGKTNAKDLATQLQYLTAFLTEPGFNAGAFEQMRSSLQAVLPQIQAQPISNMGMQLSTYLHNNDPRWTMMPTLEGLKNLKMDSVRAWLEPMLKQGALQVSIVGDISVDQAIAYATATVGAINARPAPGLQVFPSGTISFPAPVTQPVQLTHTGSSDQSAVAIAWPMPVWRGNKDEVPTLRVLGAIMQDRLLQAVRSDNGASYTANVGVAGSFNVSDYGYLAATSVVKPDQVQSLLSTINTIVADLRSKAVSAEELQRTVNPILSTIEKGKQNNTNLVMNLMSPDIDVLSIEQYTKQTDRIEAVTPEMIQQAAAKYLVDDKAWKAVMAPTQLTNAAR